MFDDEGSFLKSYGYIAVAFYLSLTLECRKSYAGPIIASLLSK